MAAEPAARIPSKEAAPMVDPPTFPRAERRTLPCGVRLVLLDLPWTHWVQIQVAVRAGAVYETDENAGISHFLEHLRCRAFVDDHGRSSSVDRALDALGAYLEAYTSPDHSAYLVQGRPERLGGCLDVVRRMLFRPDISPELVETEKEMIQSEYTSGSDDPEEVEYMARERILGAESLGRTAIGTPEAVRKLTVEELREFDRRIYVPANVVLVLAGRLDRGRLEEALASWEGAERDRPGDRPEPNCQPAKNGRLPEPDILFERVQRASCDLVFAYPAFGEGDPSLLAASMLRHVLHQRISERLRCAGTPLYDLWLHTHSYRREGIFFVGARVTGALVETVEAMNEEIRKMAREGPTEGETERAKEWNRTYLVQMLDRPDDSAARLAIEELYGTRLDPAVEWRMTDEIRKDDLRAVAGKLLDPRSLAFCLMGNPGFREKRQIRRILREAARNGDT